MVRDFYQRVTIFSTFELLQLMPELCIMKHYIFCLRKTKRQKNPYLQDVNFGLKFFFKKRTAQTVHLLKQKIILNLQSKES